MGISKGCFAWVGVAAMMGPWRLFAADAAAPGAAGVVVVIKVTAQ